MSEITPAASQPGPTSDVGQCDGLSLPMETQIGDRFTDEEGEWEVVSHPVTLYGAKSLRARVRRTKQPAAGREVTWRACESRGSPGRQPLMKQPPLLMRREDVIDHPTSIGRYIDPVDAFVYCATAVAIFYEVMRR